LVDKHPLHYQPGFEMVDSEKQEITNPHYKQKQGLLARLKTQLNKSYKKFSKIKSQCALSLLNNPAAVRPKSSFAENYPP
jgi:hypothetical protein